MVLGLVVLPEVLLPMLPAVPPEALEPVLAPYWRTQLSRSRPTRPMHWLGVDALLPTPASVLEPTPEPVALGELVDPVLEPTLDPVLAPAPVEPLMPPALVPPADVPPALLPALPAAPPEAPPEAPPAPPDCAHDAPATATNAAATAAAIVLTITIESPWSVKQDCGRGVARLVPDCFVVSL